MRASETTEMVFDNCRVPKANLLGKEGEGFKQAMRVLDGGRISIAALALGIAQGALKAAINYAK
jgi:alkylation response protein AidB-like acyl-CoA dehydrogenase